jgi:hypothetical protein
MIYRRKCRVTIYAALRLLLTHEPLSLETGPRPRHFHDEDAQTLAEKILSMYTELLM